MWRWLKEFLIGPPLETAVLHEQRLSKKAALAVLASDNLSSTAYATEEILLAFTAAAALGTAIPLSYSIPVAAAIVILTAIVAVSYSQTLHAYPTGGGAYTVAKENIGVMPALVAGIALLIDYVLTVAVSVAAGIAALTSAFPALYPHRITLCLLAIAFILVANLRGVRESAAIFAGPVYLFIACLALLVIGGLVQIFTGHPLPAEALPPARPVVWDWVVLFALSRAFASGCVALTGIEAVANGVRIFRPPVSRNASITLYVMAGSLAVFFLGITILAYQFHVLPRDGETVVSQLGRIVFGAGPIYYLIQTMTLAILVLAANTSFADFPRLASVLAQDRFLPRQLANLGDRLVFSNGILVLSLLAGALIVGFDAKVHNLIPLYMVGVFISFTLSQAGMVVHWRHSQEPGAFLRSAVNALGALITTFVLLVVAIVKFMHGAWVIVAAIPFGVWICLRIRQHYYVLGRELSLLDYETPRPRRNTVIVPVAGMNKVVLAAIEYAHSISQDVIAVNVNLDHADRGELERRWQAWAKDTPLVVLNSPYRSILRPVLQFVDEISRLRPEDVITVVLPEFVPARWWHELMHNQTGLLLRSALLFKPRVIVTSVRHHLAR